MQHPQEAESDACLQDVPEEQQKPCGTFHTARHPRGLLWASSDNLTFWAGTGILLPHCLPPAYIRKGEKTLVSFNICRKQRLAFHWFDCVRQGELSLLLHAAVTREELTFCSAVTSCSLKSLLKTQRYRNFCPCRILHAFAQTSSDPCQTRQAKSQKHSSLLGKNLWVFITFMEIILIHSPVAAIKCKNPQNQHVINLTNRTGWAQIWPERRNLTYYAALDEILICTISNVLWNFTRPTYYSPKQYLSREISPINSASQYIYIRPARHRRWGTGSVLLVRTYYVHAGLQRKSILKHTEGFVRAGASHENQSWDRGRKKIILFLVALGFPSWRFPFEWWIFKPQPARWLQETCATESVSHKGDAGRAVNNPRGDCTALLNSFELHSLCLLDAKVQFSSLFNQSKMQMLLLDILSLLFQGSESVIYVNN